MLYVQLPTIVLNLGEMVKGNFRKPMVTLLLKGLVQGYIPVISNTLLLIIYL